MKSSKLIAKAVTAALVMGSGSAFAYLPTSNTDADITLYWGGATASSLSAMELTVNAICTSNTNILYVPTSATNGAPSNDWAVACQTNNTKVPGIVGSPRVLVVKRDRDGSGVGVGPVQTKAADAGAQITFLNVTPANCPNPVLTTLTGAPNIANPSGGLVPLQGCTATYNFSAFTEMGTSDIEPDKFFDINTPLVDGVGLPFRTETDRAFAAKASLAALMFNTPVTLTLRNALQSIQFPTTNVCNPTNASYTALTTITTDRADATNAESEACMPSLSRQEINSLLTGKMLTWDLLDPALPASDVIICRRVNGSGSQATLNALMSSWPCDTNAKDLNIDILNPLVPDGTFVIGNSGSGDVSTCLNSRSAGYAIGVLSVEGRNNANNLGWRYIKVDGVSPTLNNAHNGDYWFWAQQSCQRRNNALPYNVNAARPSDTIANKTNLFNALCGATAVRGLNSLDALTKLNNPLNAGATCPIGAGAVTANTCQSLYTWGQAGWLATPTTALVFDQALNSLTRPINAYTREISAGVPNICQTPTKSDFGGNGSVAGDVSPNPIGVFP